MKALVISDSHGARENLRVLMELAETEIRPDALIFCGDGIHDILPYQKTVPLFLAVRGNCDLSPPPGIPAERMERLHGLWVYIAHGHKLRVKQSMLALSYRAREAGAKVACFGHTHRALSEWKDGILLLNPGALCDGRYAVLEVRELGEVRAELKGLV